LSTELAGSANESEILCVLWVSDRKMDARIWARLIANDAESACGDTARQDLDKLRGPGYISGCSWKALFAWSE
jgi:hypothetical protein